MRMAYGYRRHKEIRPNIAPCPADKLFDCYGLLAQVFEGVEKLTVWPTEPEKKDSDGGPAN